MKYSVIIPARYESSRLPGKPLVKLEGKAMILRTHEQCTAACDPKRVFVATDDSRVQSVCAANGVQVIMTSPDCATGTDRVAECATHLDSDVFINVQGDEPLAAPDDILRCIELKAERPEYIINGFCWIGPDEDPSSVNIPKVITNEKGIMVYMSRKPLPGFKDAGNAPDGYMKQVCIYGFSRRDLQDFAGFERKSALEQSEDIEILRFLELERPVMMYACQPGSLAVDVPEDIPKVEQALRAAYPE